MMRLFCRYHAASPLVSLTTLFQPAAQLFALAAAEFAEYGPATSRFVHEFLRLLFELLACRRLFSPNLAFAESAWRSDYLIGQFRCRHCWRPRLNQRKGW